jgi:hypothetical protein
MNRLGIWITIFAVSAVLNAVAQQPPCCFAVLNTAGQPVLMARLGDAAYKAGIAPSVEWGLMDEKTPLLDKKGQVISGFGFYGWMEGGNVRVAVVARLPPEGAENRIYRWPELNKTGMKPRLEVFATYTLAAGETHSMDELRALGLSAVALRSESQPPRR